MGLTIACGGGGEDGTSAGMAGTDSTTGAQTSAEASTSTLDETGGSASSATQTGGSAESSETNDTSAGPGTGSDDGSQTGANTEGDEGSTGNPLPRGQWAVTEITYTEGGSTETLSMQDRTFCDATLSAQGLLLRYQQAQGYTVWSVTIPAESNPGSIPLTQDFSGAYMNINEVGDTWQAYFDPSMAFGTLELTDAQVEAGGVVAGTLTASLTSQDGSTTAQFESTFYAEIP